MNPEIFKAYDIRGVYPDDFNEDDAWKIGQATARFLPSLIKGYDRGLRGGPVPGGQPGHADAQRAAGPGPDRRHPVGRRRRHRHRHDRHARRSTSPSTTWAPAAASR